MFNRLQRKSFEVEARQWGSVAGCLGPDETPIDYVRYRPDRDYGWLYLTDQRVFWTEGPPGGQQVVGEVPLGRIRKLRLFQGGPTAVTFAWERPDGKQKWLFFTKGRGVPEGLAKQFMRQLAAATGVAID